MKKLISAVVIASLFYIAYPLDTRPQLVKMVEKVMPSVVEIQVTGKMETLGLVGDKKIRKVGVLGSGVFISKTGHILTCAHLFSEFVGPMKIRIISPNGDVVSGEVVKLGKRVDLALVQASFYKSTPAVKLSNPLRIAVGQSVFAIGSPLGLSFSVSHGIISALYRDFDDYAYNVTQSDTFINPGNSGGPLFDMSGRLVGINSFMQSNSPFATFSGLGFSVQCGECIKFLTDCKKIDKSLKFSW